MLLVPASLIMGKLSSEINGYKSACLFAGRAGFIVFLRRAVFKASIYVSNLSSFCLFYATFGLWIFKCLRTLILGLTSRSDITRRVGEFPLPL